LIVVGLAPVDRKALTVTASSITAPDGVNKNFISSFERAPSDLAARYVASRFGVDLRIAALIAALATLGEIQQ
jgi:hypothetical protein